MRACFGCQHQELRASSASGSCPYFWSQVVKNGGAAVAKPYLAWACMQLGVQNMYDDFEQRIAMRSSDVGDVEPEEEMSLEDMIKDNQPT
jgi:hypothetical protein